MACYRAGQFERAIECAEESNSRPWGNQLTRTQNWLLMAIVNQRLGRLDEAQRWYTRAKRVITEATSNGSSSNIFPVDWISMHVLRREAEELFQKENINGITEVVPTNASD